MRAGPALNYYLSLPLVALAVLALGSALIYGFFMVGRIPVFGVLFILLGMLGTIGSMLASLPWRRRVEDPGPELDLGENARLRETLEDLARKIGTRPVDRVFLTAHMELNVFERGGQLARLLGRTERCLCLGVGLLDGLEQRAFRAVLAHEYGHFSNRDTAGGRLALSVRQSVEQSLATFAQNGLALPINPAWLFTRAFRAMFLPISQGASRLQEVLADRRAVQVAGAAAFEGGLRHIVARSVAFGVHVNATVKEASDHRVALRNLYTYRPTRVTLPTSQQLALEIERELERPGTPYDSHPPPRDRIAMARAMGGGQGSPAASPGDPAWALFSNRARIEEELTDEVRFDLMNRLGINLLRPGAAPAAGSGSPAI